MPGRAVYLWTPTVKLWPPLEHWRHHQHINTINSLIHCFIAIYEKHIRPKNVINGEPQETPRAAKRKEEKKHWSITNLVSFAESANQCRLTCFRTKSDSLNTADPWKLTRNRGVLFLIEESHKEMQNKARSDRQMAIQAMLQVQVRSGDTLTNKIHSLT